MNFAILHGAHGGPDTNWFPWLRDRLAAAGHPVRVPRFPTPSGQSLEAWIRIAADEVASDPGETVLIAHSLGVALALRMAERSSQPYAGAFLVSGFIGQLGLPDYDPINASFFATDFDWRAVRSNLAQAHCFAGSNDPYVPLHRTRDIADRLECALTVIAGGGHLNAETGYVRFDTLAQSLERFLSTV